MNKLKNHLAKKVSLLGDLVEEPHSAAGPLRVAVEQRLRRHLGQRARHGQRRRVPADAFRQLAEVGYVHAPECAEVYVADLQ